jgi:hypothetical protein
VDLLHLRHWSDAYQPSSSSVGCGYDRCSCCDVCQCRSRGNNNTGSVTIKAHCDFDSGFAVHGAEDLGVVLIFTAQSDVIKDFPIVLIMLY